MANSIALAQKYVPLLDEVYKAESKTAILDATDIQFTGANTIKVLKSTLEGLGNYSRSTGFPSGSINAEWETMELTCDRGKTFSLDSMDNEETASVMAGKLMGQFLREYVVPELDSYRFAKYSSNAGTKKAITSLSGVNLADEIATAQEVMGDAEVPEDGRILFISNPAYKILKGNISRSLKNESEVMRFVQYYDNMPVFVVPKGRFNTAITLGDTGYTQSGSAIHFMIVHPTAVLQTIKHAVPRIFDPATNQSADAWKFDYRVYHDCFDYENKTKGIYVAHA